ncbi:MAG: M23 family metallopeptidase [Psychrosphaera sp.]|nr:M23 family metallopeptidase [Psychrosphaera sp.]
MSLLLLLLAGLLWPENLSIPVKGATNNDWNHQTFWYEPWGSSGVHKGIDIFGKTGTEVIASTGGIVVFSGQLPKGGNAIAVLGPKWRIHYFAHLNTRLVSAGTMVAQNEQIGTLGDTGNAKGKQPHVHYSIVSIVPIPWRLSMQTQGWKRMFFLNPHDKLL